MKEKELLTRLQQMDRALTAAAYAWENMVKDYVVLKQEVLRQIQLSQKPPEKPDKKDPKKGA